HHPHTPLPLIAQLEHEPREPARSAAIPPSPASSPPAPSAHHRARRYAQSSPTYLTTGLLPDRSRHRRVSPASRPFFITFSKATSAPTRSASPAVSRTSDAPGNVRRLPDTRSRGALPRPRSHPEKNYGHS